MFNKEKVKLGIAPIAWTNDDMPELGGENTFEQCISEMALAGFTGCEIGTKYPEKAADIKSALELRGMRIASRWFSSFLTTNPYEQTEREFIKELEFLSLLDAHRINVSEQGHSIQGEMCTSIFDCKYNSNDEEWDSLCTGLNKLGKIAHEYGFKLCFHHHMGTVVQTKDEIDRLMENTNPDYVYLCYDTGHFSFSGDDYIEILRKYVNRIGHVHLKDVRKKIVNQSKNENWSFLTAVRNGVFTVPGDGDLDFEPVFEILDRAGYEGWLLVEAEQDPANANPLEYAMKARKFIEEKTGL